MNHQPYWTSRRKGISLSAAFLLVLLVAVSCKKETNTLGIGACKLLGEVLATKKNLQVGLSPDFTLPC
jgi:hypothetical protein